MSDESLAAAAALREKGSLDEAAALLDEILGGDAGDAAAWVELGIVRLGQDNAAAAEACFRRAIEVDESVVAAHFNLARLLLNQDPAEAAAGFATVTRLDPELAEGHHGLARALAAEGRLAEAATAGRRALELRPKWPEAAAQLAALAIESGDLEGAGEVLEAWGANQPEDAERLFLAGCLAHEKGELEAAAGFFERAIAGACQSDAEARLGSVLVRLGRLEDSKTAAHRALERDAEDARAHNTLGNLAMIGGDPAGAEPAFRRAREFEPANPIAWRNLGDAMLRQGQHAAAREIFAELAKVPGGAAMAHDGNAAVLQTEGRGPSRGSHREPAARPRARSRLPGGADQPGHLAAGRQSAPGSRRGLRTRPRAAPRHGDGAI